MSTQEKKSGFVTLIGRPNVGKSTLMNHLIGQKIAITSDKPQTTRNRIQTVYTDERGQIVFLDTPGIHKAKNKLGEYMVNIAEHTLKEVDVILWLVEPTTFIGAGERHIAQQLNRVSTPVILVINKIDTVRQQEDILTYINAYKDICPFAEIVPVSALKKKGTDLPVILVINKIDTVRQQEDILTYINAYKDICPFAEIVPVSALKKKGTDLLLDLMFKYLPYGPELYDEDTVTDQPMRQIAAELIREKALRLLDDEIPHGIAVTIEKMQERPNGIMDIEATIICERDSHKGIIIGKGGSMLKRIGSAARREIEKMMEIQVNLQLWVKVRKEWRDSDILMKNYGYNQKDV